MLDRRTSAVVRSSHAKLHQNLHPERPPRWLVWRGRVRRPDAGGFRSDLGYAGGGFSDCIAGVAGSSRPADLRRVCRKQRKDCQPRSVCQSKNREIRHAKTPKTRWLVVKTGLAENTGSRFSHIRSPDSPASRNPSRLKSNARF